MLKYVCYTSVSHYMEWRELFDDNTTREKQLKSLRNQEMLHIDLRIPTDIVQVEGHYVTRILRTAMHFKREEVDSFKKDNSLLTNQLVGLAGYPLLMITKSISPAHNGIEVHCYALHYCIKSQAWWMLFSSQTNAKLPSQPSRATWDCSNRRRHPLHLLCRRLSGKWMTKG